MIIDYAIVVKLLVSLACAGIIGLEREARNKAGGFRTHILVGVGATLITIVSMSGVDNADPWRLSAQVISGIGFLGTGTILRDKSGVSGLTTAASLWVTAGIGIALGAGMYFPSLIALVLVMFSLVPLGFFRSKFANHTSRYIINCQNNKGLLGKISKAYFESNLDIKDIKVKHINGDQSHLVDVVIKSDYVSPSEQIQLVKVLYSIEEVRDVHLN